MDDFVRSTSTTDGTVSPSEQSSSSASNIPQEQENNNKNSEVEPVGQNGTSFNFEAAYNGIKTYVNLKEAESNGNAGRKDTGMVRDTLQGHSEGSESTETEARGELEVPASGRISEGGNEGETVSGLTSTQLNKGAKMVRRSTYIKGI